MGVKTSISLASLNTLFPSYNFTSITPTKDGIVDTTYLASSSSKDYIVKKYERDIEEKIQEDIKLLASLKSKGLNVPLCLDEKDGWFIYEKLSGEMPKLTHTYHIQALARFIAKMHKVTYKQKHSSDFYESYEVPKLLQVVKLKHFSYYKKLSSLDSYKPKHDGIIHGDIFRDNTVFDKDKIGVFDFIDSGSGSFVFECAVSIIGFGVKKENKYFINLFLNTYNQHAPKKIDKKELVKHLSIAAKFYALLRISHHNSTSKAKELL